MKSTFSFFRLTVVLITSFSTLATVQAVQPQRSVIDSLDQLSRGRAVSAVLTAPGSIEPGIAHDLVHDFGSLVLWDVARLPVTGDLVIGTGPHGEVFRADRSGRVKRLTAFSEPDVHAIAVGPDAAIYAAPSPGGKIFRRTGTGDFELWFETGEEFVWDLYVGADGVVLAATGAQGKLFRITGRNRGEVVFDAAEPHLRRVLPDGAGGWVVGTSGPGLVYRIPAFDTKGALPVVVLDSGRQEIASLAVDEDGSVFASAVGKDGAGPTTSKSSGPSSSVVISGGRTAVLSFGNGSTDGANPAAATAAVGAKATKAPEIICEVFRIDSRDFPEVVLRSPVDISSLLFHSGRLWAGAAERGAVLWLDRDGLQGRVAELDSRQVSGLLDDGRGSIAVLGNHLARLFRINPERRIAGTYQSKVIDSGLFAEWGRLEVSGSGRWTLRARSGNTADPDKSWHPWRFVQGGEAPSPPARYAQIEVVVDSGSVERMVLNYLPENQPPRVGRVRVLEPNLAMQLIPAPPQNEKVQTIGQLLTESESSAPTENPDRFRPVRDSGWRTVLWEASDPNRDALVYQLEVRKDGGDWETLAERLESPIFSWDTRGWSDGIYTARVTASDARDNAPGRERRHAAESEAWRIDHTAPTLRVVSQSPQALRIEASDSVGYIASAAISEDGHQFRPLAPGDGILDSRREVFLIDRREGLPLYIRITDDSGNIAGHYSPAHP